MSVNGSLAGTLRYKWRERSSNLASSSGSSPLQNVTGVSRQAARGQDVSQINGEEPQIQDLNAALSILVEVFPNVQPEVFREMLTSMGSESLLQIVTENILKEEARYVRGRLRVPNEDDPAEVQNGRQKHNPRTLLKPGERFRSASYRNAVTDALCREFKGMNRSAMLAVLAECNYSYFLARPMLLEVMSKSWRYSVSRFIFRRKVPTVEEHPLVAWESVRLGTSTITQPTLRFTPSTELNLELWNVLIQPVLDMQKDAQVRQDYELSKELNEVQAQEVDELYECKCCFSSFAVEQLASCSSQCHYICHDCVRRTVNEALFGQGWSRSIDHDRGTVRCIAPVVSSGASCDGFIPSSMLQLALQGPSGSKDTWVKLQDRFASEHMQKSGLPLIRCPFCVYAEVDDFDMSKVRWNWPIAHSIAAVFVALQLLLLLLRSRIARVLALTTTLTLGALILLNAPAFSPRSFLEASLLRISRRRRGLRFSCASPRCGRASCLNCRKAWTDIHLCFESSRLALRAAVEAATTEAVKRTCPVCNLSFVKEAGCNKLTCVCGYTMCYTCRREIGSERYGHFCQHFRQRPGEPCGECDRCDLYRVEDEDALVREAALKAEVDWWERERRAEDEGGGGGGGGGVDGKAEADGRQRRALEIERLDVTAAHGQLETWLRKGISRAFWDGVADLLLGYLVV